MDEFPAMLKSLLDVEGRGQVDLARSIGWSQSKVSRILAGLVPVERADVAALVTAISTDRSRRIALLLAYLRDVGRSCHSSAGFDDRHYLIKATDDTETSPGADLELLAEMSVRFEDVRDVVADLASLLRRSSATEDRLAVFLAAEEADQSAKKKPRKPSGPSGG